MSKIKFCGLTNQADVQIVNNILPDFVGFVFFNLSRRFVSLKKFLELKRLLDRKISVVGVFVDEKLSTVADVSKNLDFIQLHGSESEIYISNLKNFTDKKIIKAFKINNSINLSLVENSSADFVLLDNGMGTGKVFNWQLVKKIQRDYFLAGGLTIQNVGSAIKLLNPYAVDVSSGIESNGFKDAEKMKNFIQFVRSEICL